MLSRQDSNLPRCLLAAKGALDLVIASRPVQHVVVNDAEVDIFLRFVEGQAPGHLPVVGRVAAAGERYIQVGDRIRYPRHGDSRRERLRAELAEVRKEAQAKAIECAKLAGQVEALRGLPAKG